MNFLVYRVNSFKKTISFIVDIYSKQGNEKIICLLGQVEIKDYK